MANYKGKKLAWILVGFLRLIRVFNLLIISFTQYAVAIFLIGPSKYWYEYLTDTKLFLVVVSTFLVAAAGYIINDYYDVKIDAVNKPKRMVIDRIIRRREAMLLHFVLSFLSVLLACAVSFKIGAITLVSSFILWYYSNDMKRKALMGNLAISFLTGMAIIVVSIYYHKGYEQVGVYAIFSFLISLIREIIKDMEDIKGDESFGCRTLPIVYGIRNTKNIVYSISIILVTFHFLIAFYYQIQLLKILAYFMFVSMGLFSYYVYRADTRKLFSELSFACKLIMLGGVFSMFFWP